MSHFISPATIAFAVFGITGIVIVVKFAGPMAKKVSTVIGNHRRAVFAAIPIIGCNVTAFTGQLFFLRAHQSTWPEISIIGLAATMESIALFLASEASEREKKGDSSFNVRMSSYAFGLFVGLINYSHYAIGFRPTVFAIIFGSMSSLSPILWALYGRGQAREILLERGVIEPRGVKFAKVRWLLWPRETFGAMRLAAWSGERNPDQAIKDYETARESKRIAAEALVNLKELQIETAERIKREAIESAERDAKAEREAIESREAEITNALSNATSQAECIRIALCYSHDQTPNGIVAWLAQRGIMDVKPANVRVTKARERGTEPNAVDSEREGLHAV